MVVNPLTLLQERQCASIYTALDAGNASLALRQCDALLSSQPDLHLASALKALALIRLGRKDEAGRLADAVIKSQAALKSSVVLTPLCMVLSSLECLRDEVEVLDAASKANPTSADVGAKAFLAMVRASQWQRAQQTSLRVHKIASAKNKGADEYFWSSMQAYSLIASDPSLPGHQLALPLAQRMMAKHLETHPFGPQSDEIMFLYANVLRKQGKGQKQEALQLLNSEDRGKELCKRSMTLAALRYDLMEEVGDWEAIYTEAMSALETGHRNWSKVQEAVKGAAQLAVRDESFSLSDIEGRLAALAKGKARDRTMKLAPLYLIKEVRHLEKQLQMTTLLAPFTAYFDVFSSKACGYEDLAPYVPVLSDQEVQSALQSMQKDIKPPSNGAFEDIDSLYRNLNACKLARLMQPEKSTTAASEAEIAREYFALYLCALPIGKGLPKTEMQPADDYALLAAQALVHASVLQREEGSGEAICSLHLAIVLLTCALRYSPKGYRLRVLLIRLLRQCGAIDVARTEYEEIGVKSIQHDTLGWVLSSRGAFASSLLKAKSQQEEAYATAVRRLQVVWKEGRTQVPQMVCKSFESGIYSRVEEMVDFGKRLEHSMTRYLAAVETARSPGLQRVGGNDSNRSRVLSDLQECATALSKGQVSDQQDHNVLLDLMPASSRRIEALTAAAAPTEPTAAYLQAMLPVAMAHQGLAVGKGAEPAAQGAELSAMEALLSQLAVNLDGNDNAAAAEKASQLFKAAKKTLEQQQPGALPCTMLHAASTALEAFELLARVRERKGDGAGWEMKASHTSMSSLLELLKGASWSDAAPLSSQWRSLLDQLPSTLRAGLDGKTLVETKNRELQEAREAARGALTERIEDALKRQAH